MLQADARTARHEFDGVLCKRKYWRTRRLSMVFWPILKRRIKVTEIFPYSNLVIGILVLIVGFVFHWIAQLISFINWEFAIKIGLQEKGMPKEFKVYEHAIAGADVLIGWIYGIAGIGLILNLPWSYKLLWFPGIILIYHGISVWFWMGNQKKIGQQLVSDNFKIIWSTINIITGVLTTVTAWQIG